MAKILIALLLTASSAHVYSNRPSYVFRDDMLSALKPSNKASIYALPLLPCLADYSSYHMGGYDQNHMNHFSVVVGIIDANDDLTGQ
jgi:hypothetical protein